MYLLAKPLKLSIRVYTVLQSPTYLKLNMSFIFLSLSAYNTTFYSPVDVVLAVAVVVAAVAPNENPPGEAIDVAPL